MSSSKTLQSGVRPSQAIKDPKKRTGLLKDNSWIKRDVEEDEPVDVDPNYGRDILKTRTSNGSKPAVAPPTSPAPTVPSTKSLTKRINGNQDSPDKSSVSSLSKTIATSLTVATSPTSTTPNKPPVPVKNPTLSSGSKSFTARVFSGASSNEKTISPVKTPVDEKPPVLKEPPKEITNGLVKKTVDEKPPVLKQPPQEITSSGKTAPLSPVNIIKPATTTVTKSESKPSVPQTPAVTTPSTVSQSQATATFTSPEKTQPPTATKTEPSKSYEQSNGKPDPNITKTATTTSPQTAASSVKAPSKALDDLFDTLVPTNSSTVQSNPVSPKTPSDTLSYSSSQLSNSSSPKTPSDAWSYSSSPISNTTSTTVRSEVIQSPTVLKTVQSPPVNSPLSTKLPSNRIVGKRDLCSFCGKNITGGDRMILDELQIFSHSSCFKCEMCYRSLGSLEAGATLWVHRDKVNCENCYRKTRDKWFI